jgi:thiamine pyrophosphate-dependent acetolactate synthase large subunit-like protein
VYACGPTIPITKHNYLVHAATQLLEVIPEAFRIAASGRPGLVVIDVPKDERNTRWLRLASTMRVSRTASSARPPRTSTTVWW